MTYLTISRKRLTLLAPLFVGLLAVSLRLVLFAHYWPIANADESIIDLMARHVAYQGDHPLFFWGQYYMGTIQAYLGAFFIHFFGSSAFNARLGTLFLFTLYLVCLYLLVRLLYTPAYALFITALLSIGSNRMMSIPLMANGGYAETMFFASLIFLLTSWLVLTTPKQRVPVNIRRLLVYGALGLTVGLAIWSDQLILAAVVTAGLFLGWRCLQELRGWATGMLLLGFLLGSFPLLVFNLSAEPGQNSLVVLLGDVSLSAPRILPYSEQFAHVLFISLPVITGVPFSSVCTTSEPYTHVSGSLLALFSTSPHPWFCLGLRGGWSLGILFLWGIALVSVFLAMHKLRSKHHSEGYPVVERFVVQERTLLEGRFMLLAAGAIWLVLFAFSGAAQYTPRESSRYLVCLLIVAPAIFWPLWQCVGNIREALMLHRFAARSRFFLSLLVLGSVIGAYGIGIGDIVVNLPMDQQAYNQTNRLIQTLREHGATDVYSDYPTCSLLIFQSNEHVICGVLNDRLQPGVNRYQPYWLRVRADPYAAYLFPLNSPSAQALRLHVKQNEPYQCINVSGYLICYDHTHPYCVTRNYTRKQLQGR